MYVKIVSVPSVVTVGEPVVVPEYRFVGILNITTPLEPFPPLQPPPEEFDEQPPPPEPRFAGEASPPSCEIEPPKTPPPIPQITFL